MKKKRKGFTLVELVIVIAVIAVLAAVLVPTFSTVMEKAHNSADTQLVRNMNTVMSTNLDENVTATAENLRKYLKDNGITDIGTKNSDVVIVYNKTTKQFERMNVKKTLGNKDGEISVMRAKAEGKEEIFTKNPYSPEEIFTDRIIVSTEGNDLAEGLYALHNIENEEDVANKKNILKNIDDEILSKLEPIVVTTLYVGKDGDPFRLTLSGGAISVNNDSGSNTVKRVVFNEECTTVNLETLAEKTTGSNVYVVIPDTVESVEKAETAEFDEGTRFFGNTDVLENAGAANIQEKVAESSISEMQEKFFGDEGESLKELVGTTKFYVSGEASGIDHYTSLVDALSAAAQSAQNDPAHAEKHVYLQKDYELSANITIPEHVTLVLPYDETNEANKTTTDKTSSFGVDGKCYVTLNVADNVVITNNGTITIGGVTTGQQGGQSGCTAGAYAQITLGKEAKIDSYGDINAYGFITEATEQNGSQVIMNSGSLLMPFIVVEHRGGSAYYAMYQDKFKGAPFNRYYMENCTAFLTIKSTAHLLGYANLYASSQDNTTNIKLAGNGGDEMIQLQDDSYFTMDCSFDTKIADIKIYGNFVLNPLTLNVVGINVSMQQTYFPFSYLQQITLLPNGDNEAVVDCTKQDIKLFPGAKIEIKKNVTVNAKNIVIYTGSYVDENKYGSIAIWKYPTADKGNGKLIIEGTLTADGIGGPVIAGGSGATLTVKSNNSITSYEVQNVTGTFIFASCTWSEYENILKGSIYHHDGNVDDQELSVGTYTSKDGAWITDESTFGDEV